MKRFTQAMKRNFGVEIEISGGNFSQMREEIRQFNSRQAQCQRWDFKSEHCGKEIVSPILSGKKGFKALETVLEILNRNGATVDRRCGLHVHLDIRAWNRLRSDVLIENARRFQKFYVKYEQYIDSLMPRSRKEDNNGFTQGWRHIGNIENCFERIDECRSIHGLQYEFQGGRYRKVNWHAFDRHGSVEVRHHGATTDYTKISNWVFFLLGLIDQSEKQSTRIAPHNRGTKNMNNEQRLSHMHDRMMKLVKADDEMKSYFSARSQAMR